jgi:hypothetical protein
MALDQNINTLEKSKFLETETNETAVRVSVSGGDLTGNFTVTGLKIGGRVTEVALNSSTWTPLPATPLADRNAMAIQNPSGIEIKINYASDISGYVGVRIISGAERQYDIGPTIILYGKSESGTPTIYVEEIA